MRASRWAIAVTVLVGGGALAGVVGWEAFNRGDGRPGLPDSGYFESVEIASNDEIRERILGETPGLDAAIESGDDLAVVRLLRGWSARQMDLNGGGTSYWLELDRRDRTLGNMLYLFDENLLGVHCGDGSRFLLYVYGLFGYEAVIYNSGVYFGAEERRALNEGKTHVITIVRVDRDGRELWVPEDILFDSEYRLPGEVVSDFGEIVARLRADPATPIERVHDDRVFDRDRHEISSASPTDGAEPASFDEFARGIHSTRGPDSYKLGWDRWIPQDSGSARILREVLEFDGPVYPYHLFLFPIGRAWGVPGVGDLETMEEAYEAHRSSGGVS